MFSRDCVERLSSISHIVHMNFFFTMVAALTRGAMFLRGKRMLGDEIEVYFAHVSCQFWSSELGFVEILEARVTDRVGALDARMATKS